MSFGVIKKHNYGSLILSVPAKIIGNLFIIWFRSIRLRFISLKIIRPKIIRFKIKARMYLPFSKKFKKNILLYGLTKWKRVSSQLQIFFFHSDITRWVSKQKCKHKKQKHSKQFIIRKILMRLLTCRYLRYWMRSSSDSRRSGCWQMLVPDPWCFWRYIVISCRGILLMMKYAIGVIYHPVKRNLQFIYIINSTQELFAW